MYGFYSALVPLVGVGSISFGDAVCLGDCDSPLCALHRPLCLEDLTVLVMCYSGVILRILCVMGFHIARNRRQDLSRFNR